MRKPLSIVTQCIVAAIVLAAGATLWVAREPVTTAMASLLGTENGSKGARKGRRGRRTAAAPVVIADVSEGADALLFAGIGTARAIRHVTLFPAVSAEVVKVLTEAGERVEENAKLIELDPEQAKLSIEMATSKLADAKRQLARADQLRQRRVQSRAKVQDARALADQAAVELKTARITLSDHTITAPFAGIVGIASVEVGDRVTPTTALVTIDDRSVLTVEFAVPESYLPRLRRGLEIDVRTPGFADRVFKGRLSRIDSRVHPERRTVTVRAEVANDEDLLRPGMSFAVDLQLPGKIYPRIPDLALQFNQDGNFVWLVRDGKSQRVTVRIVRRQANTVLVDGTLSPGEKIVIEGVQRLRPNKVVSVAGTSPLSSDPQSAVTTQTN